MEVFSSKTFKKAVAFLCMGLILFPSASLSAQSFFKTTTFFSDEKIPEIPLSTRTQLVSILVEESLLENSVLVEKIERYARDVQKAINGKSILIPIPKDFSPYEIFEGNSALYFSGEEEDHLSQLVGTILIGEIPIPIVEKNESYHPTLFPYTDFENVNYVWSSDLERFVFERGGDEHPEIWHGVIRSDIDTGDESTDKTQRVQELEDFLDRNHLLHEGGLNFNKKVFYADLLTQKRGLPDLVKNAYSKWIDNIDHILYKRYSKKLAQDLFADQGLDEIIPTEYLPSNARSSSSAEIEFDTLPDIYSKGVLDSIIRRYFENYEGYLSNLYDQVGAAGRWTPEEIDTTITLLSEKDETAANLLKDFNDALEKILLEEVENKGIANDIYIPTKKIYRKVAQKILPPEYATLQHEEKELYWNGISRIDIDMASKCSLRRGYPASPEYPYSQLVESSNAFDLSTTNQCPDIDHEENPPSQFQINADKYEGCCAANLSYSSSSGFSNNACIPSSDWAPACETSIFGLGNDCFLKGTNIVQTMREGFVHRGAEISLFNWAGAKKISSGTIGASACPDVVFDPLTFSDLIVPKECTDATISWIGGAGFGDVLAQCSLVSDANAVISEAQNILTTAGNDVLAQGLVVDPYTNPSPCSNFSDPDTCSFISPLSLISSQSAEQTIFNDLLQEYIDIKNLKETFLDPAYDDVVQAHKAAAETQIELDPATSGLQLLNAFTDISDLETLKNKKQDEEDDFEIAYEDGGNAGSVRTAYQQSSLNGLTSLLPLLQDVIDGFSSWELEKERETETRLGTPFSSLMNHVEPTKEALDAQLLKGKDSAPTYLPIDDPRGFSFYDHDPTSPSFHRIAYPNIFSFRDEFLLEEENLRKNSLATALDKAFSNKIQEINATSGNIGKISSTVFDSLWDTFSKDQVLDALVWIDKPLEEKNQEIFGGALSDSSRAKNILHQPYFDGYEIIEIIGESSDAIDGYGIKADFEQGDDDPGSFFLEAERQELAFEFDSSLEGEISGKNSENSSLSDGSLSKRFNESNENAGCNRSLFSWSGSCLIPWITELPKSFGKYLKIPTFFDSKTNSIVSSGVVEEKPLPEKYTVFVSPERIQRSSQDTIPQKIEIELRDDQGNLLKNDFSTTVSFSSSGSDFSRFFNISSPNTQQVQGGKISFFFSPKVTSFGGKFSWDFTINGTKKVSVPVIISTNKVVASLSKTDFLAGDPAESLNISVLDKDGHTVSDFDGYTFDFSSDKGTFSNNSEVRLKDGKATIEFIPARKSGAGTIVFSNREGVLPSEQIFIDILPNIPEKIVYKTPQNALVVGAEPSLITASITDRYGNEIPENTSPISYTGEGLKLTPSKDFPGIFVSVESDEEAPILIAESSDLNTKGLKRSFEVLSLPQIRVKNTSQTQFVVSDSKKYSIPISVLGKSPEKFLGKTRVFVLPNTESVGVFPKEIQLENGVGVLDFFPGKISGAVDVTLAADGFEPRTVSLEIIPGKAHALKLFSEKSVIDSDQTSESFVEVRAFDEYGNLATSFDDQVFVYINPPDTFSDSDLEEAISLGVTDDEDRLSYLKESLNPKDLADFYPSSVSVSPEIKQHVFNDDHIYAAKINIDGGVGLLGITPQGKTDRLYLVAKAENLIPGTDVVDINNTLSLQDFSVLSPKSLLTILGGFDGGTLQRPSMGNRFLFAGKTHGVATLLEDSDRKKVKTTLHPSGEVKGGAVSFISQEFFGISVSTDSRPVLEASLRFKGNPKVNFHKPFEDQTEILKSGIHFFPEKISSKNTLSYTRKTVFLNSEPLLKVLPTGGMIILDPRVKIVSDENSFLNWNILFEGESIIDLKMVLDSQEFFEHDVRKKSESSSRFSFSFFSQNSNKISGIFYSPLSQKYFLDSFFAGKTTNEEKGIAVFSRTEKESSDKKLGFSTVSLEDIAEERDTGWKGNWKPGIHSAAQTSLGESVRFGATDNLIFLGDPTVVFQEKNTKNGLQLTEDIGKILWKSSKGSIDEIVEGDLNNDGLAEIFPRVGNTLYSLYHDGKRVDNFRDTGPLLRFPDGAKKVVSYKDTRGDLQYIIQLNDDGELKFHKNEQGRLIRVEKDIFHEKTRLIDVQVGKVNSDSYYDLVVLDENNTIFFVHGNSENEFSSPIELYNFSPQFISLEEEHSKKIAESADDFFEKKSQENLLNTYISFDGLDRYMYSENTRDFSGKIFTPFPNTSALEAELSIGKDAGISKIGDAISAALTVSPRENMESAEILIPKLLGTSFVSDSLVCEGCFGNIDVRESETHILLQGIVFPQTGSVIFSWDFELSDIPPIQFLLEDFSGNDGIDDVAVPWEGDDKVKRFIKFISNGSEKNYPPKKSDSTPKISFLKGLYRKLMAQVFSQEKNDRPVFSSQEGFFYTHQKIIHEAFPKSSSQSPLLSGNVDSEALAKNVLGALSLETASVSDSLKNMGCGGGCGLPLPSYVFNAPGNQSLYIPPFGFPGLPSLPIPVVGLAALQIIPSVPFVLPFAPALPASFFRLFVMPTTTAQVGIGICVGPPSGFSIPPLPIGNCFVLVPPLLELLGACPANILGIENSPALQVLQGAFLSDSFQVGGFTPPMVSTPTNKKLFSADIITEWVKRQFEEFGNFKFPSINFRFPDFLSKKSSSVEKNFIQKLEDSPYIQLKKERLSIPYPDFSEAQIGSLDISWASWKTKYKTWKCDVQNKRLDESTGKCEGGEDFSLTVKKTGMAVILALLAKKEKNKFLAEAKNKFSAQLDDPDLCGIEPEKKEEFKALLQKNIEELNTGIQKNTADVQSLSQEVESIESPQLKTLGNQLLAESNRESEAFLSKESEGITVQDSAQNCEVFSQDKSFQTEEFTALLQKLERVSGEGDSSGDIDISSDVSLQATEFLEKQQNRIEKKLNVENMLRSFDTNANVLEQNVTTIKGYKSSSEALKDLPKEMKQLLKKVELNTSFIDEYFSVWVSTNKKNAAEWKNFQFELQGMMGILTSIPEIFKGLEPICTRCNVNRGSMLEWLLRILLGGIKLPVIPLPKMPDIEIDLSRIGVGFSIPVPEIKLEPVPVNIPKFPALPNINIQNLLYGVVLGLVSSMVNIDWEKELSPYSAEISQDFLMLLLLGISLDIEDFDISGISIGEILSAVFDKEFNVLIESLLKDIDISKIPNIPELVSIGVLPPLPNFAEIGVNFDLPALNLPVLPTILPPPIVPDFLGKLKTLINIPRPFFNLICFFFMGYLPVPEWKVASAVQERTNRSLLLPIDFAFAALTPIVPKSSPKKKTIEFEKTYVEFLSDINQKLTDFQTLSKCSVEQISNAENGDTNTEKCTVSESSTSAFNRNSIIETVDFFGEEFLAKKEASLEDFVSDSRVQNRVAQFKNLLTDPHVFGKDEEESQEKFFADLWGTPPVETHEYRVQDTIKNWLVSTLDIDLSRIPQNAPDSFDTQAAIDDSNEAIPYVPQMFFYDPETDISTSLISYPLQGTSFLSLTEDLDEDGEEEVLFALNDELYLKRRYDIPKPVDAFESNSDVVWWSTEKFLGKYIPTLTYKNSVEASGDTLKLAQKNGEIPYFEWTISERPDMIFEYYKEARNRFSNLWNRVGYLIRPTPKKYQIRPSSAQIKKVQGVPKLFGSPMKEVPLMEKELCEDDTVFKPFYSTETMLVSEKDNTVFNIQTKNRNGQDQKSYLKTMHAGEETLVDFAEVCLISGVLKEVTTDERIEMNVNEGDYFSSGMLLSLEEGDEVHLELFDGREIIVYEDETFELHYFENKDEFIKKFKSLNIGNHYGLLQGFVDTKTPSHTRGKLLHDPQTIDDVIAPTIQLRDGQKIETVLFEEIKIDASESYDDTGIEFFSWATNKDGVDLSQEKNEVLVFPAQNQVGSFVVTLSVSDEAGNISVQDIEIEVQAPDSEIQEASEEDLRILGAVLSPKQNIPLTIFRERNGKKSFFSSVFTLEDGGFELNLKKGGGIDVWKKNPQRKVLEILSNGRPVILDEGISYTIEPATDTMPLHFSFRDSSLKIIAVLKIGLPDSVDISFKNSNEEFINSQEKIFISNDPSGNWKWIEFESDLVQFRNTFALVDIPSNTVVGVLDSHGGFSSVKGGDVSLKTKNSFNENDPLIFQIFSSGKFAGEFQLPLENMLWVE